MKALDKIYLNRRHPEPYWFKDKQLDSDVEYISKDVLIEWAKENIDSLGRLSYGELIDKLNSM